MYDPENIKAQFPLFRKNPELAYLDNAATTQKPESVIRGITEFYENGNANIHRGIYEMAARTTQQYEAVRGKVAHFIGASSPGEIVYTTGATGGINLVAYSFLRPRLKAGDEVLISAMEHHANLIPWQMACETAGATLRVIPMNDAGELDMAAFRKQLSARTKMVALVHISNSLGTINPVEEVIEEAKKKGVPVLVDIAQSVAHYPIKAEKLGADFLVFSGHKMYGPTGIGILYGKKEHLESMPPMHYGGDMIREVNWERTTFAPPPQRFEAGTTHIAGVLGLALAIDFIESLDRAAALQHLKALRDYATEQLLRIDGLEIIGRAKQKSAILSFTLKDIHPHDLATFLGAENIAVRAGHHCTQPIMDHWGLPGTTRASFSIYNTKDEIDRLVKVLEEVKSFFG
jgi:cysteine desulfurase/selenocysteine lyase